ncbi:MAG: ABC transporter ATP-binding protein [Pseudomonadota bacterium]
MYTNPADRLKEMIFRKPYHQAFSALNEISFEVPKGGIMGIIGENGAGKSTLLKILAGTLSPSSGNVTYQGRVAALLELGAGFHPEFTGRQNIQLNASLLGLSDDEIREKTPAIIEFSDLGEFIDRPVKTYSSGMYVRLAFSIATSVDPDILIIDEALSVGDEHFQKKCVKRMREFRDSDKTILFCSHSLYLVRELCHEAIWLAGGQVNSYGECSRVINDYMAYLESKEQIDAENLPQIAPELKDRSELPDVVIEKMEILDDDGQIIDQLTQFQTLRFRIYTKCHVESAQGHLAIAFLKPDGTLAFATTTKESDLPPTRFCGQQITELRVPSFTMNSGAYLIKSIVADESAIHPFDENTSRLYAVSSNRPEFGLFWMDHEWRT